jgi:hypothetical protein
MFPETKFRKRKPREKKLIRGHSNGSEWIGNGCEWLGMARNGLGMAANGSE